jgi:hypothetical protein
LKKRVSKEKRKDYSDGIQAAQRKAVENFDAAFEQQSSDSE